MKRKPKKKKKYGFKRKPKSITIPHLELGGHMPFPPKDCTAHRLFFKKVEYIDYTNCIDCNGPTKKVQCKRLKEFQQQWRDYNRQEVEKKNKKKVYGFKRGK